MFVLKTSAVARGNTDSLYRFRSVSGEMHWPIKGGLNLGFGGVWNTLLRLGFPPKEICKTSIVSPGNGDSLFVSSDTMLDPGDMEFVRRWLSAGGIVVASGLPEAWSPFLAAKVVSGCSPYPYAALAYSGVYGKVELIAPPGWRFLEKVEKKSGVETQGTLVTIRGERQTPSRALVSTIKGAPAIVRKDRFFYLNANPFAALQAWLQGQEDLEPWLNWRHRLFWLDEMVAYLGRVLVSVGALSEPLPGMGIGGLAETTIVLRHDLDFSRDTSYLETEEEAGLPGVYAILRDMNTNFWVKKLKQKQIHESAFHFNTVTFPAVSRIRKKLGLRGVEYRPSDKLIRGKGILSQVRWAKRHGIGIETLHRHWAYLIYPEWIDAMDVVFEYERSVLGGSSTFRGQVLRWGTDRVDGANGTMSQFPDPQFPLWFPFKLAHAGDGGRLLRGWESTSVMEVEPGLFEQMLNHRIAELPQRVITLNYHPAHAKRPVFTAEGSHENFKKIVKLIKESEVEVRTLSQVYSELDSSLGEME